MVSSNNNIGQVMKNVGNITLESLKKLNIYYDEIHFGKPYGDLYIDDKAFNCYDLSLYSQMGFYDFENRLYTTFKTNKYNKIVQLTKTTIQKYGNDLEGEIYYYNTISLSLISNMFPKLISYEDTNSIIMEYINGTILYKIYYEGLLNESLLCKLLETVNIFHNSNINDKTIINTDDIYHHYFDKFISRSKVVEHYPFEDFEKITLIIHNQLSEFVNKNYKINDIIHGDLWFSNIFFFKGSFIFFDTRGKFNHKLSIKGHTFYDWAKIYQSLLGLDSIINYGTYIDHDINIISIQTFWNYLLSNNIINEIDKSYIIKLTGYLLYNTFHAYDEGFPIERKNMIWKLIKDCVYLKE